MEYFLPKLMENFWRKLTQVENKGNVALNKSMEELKYLARELVGMNGTQFEALCSCITEEAKAANNAREEGVAMALRKMQEKMDHNSKKTKTKVSRILKKVKDAEDDLQMKLREKPSEDEIITIVKNCVKNCESELNCKLQSMEDDNEGIVEDVTNDLREVEEKLESQKNELIDVKTALKSVKDELKDVRKALKSIKDVASNDTIGRAQTDHVQNVRPTLDDLSDTSKEATKMTQINKKKRNRDSRYQNFIEQNKRLRKQSNRSDKRGTASGSSTSTSSSDYRSTSTNSSNSDQNASPSSSESDSSSSSKSD